MPAARSFRRAAFVWLLRAWARRACVYCKSLAVFSSNRVTQPPESHRHLTNADIAVRTWHTVSSGFFPPKVLVDFRQE